MSDFIIGINATKKEAYTIYKNVKNFIIQTFKLNTISTSKIQHYKTEKTMFLGVEIKGTLLNKTNQLIKTLLIMPTIQIKNKLVDYNFIKRIGHLYKPTHCGRLIHKNLHEILSYYNSIRPDNYK